MIFKKKTFIYFFIIILIMSVKHKILAAPLCLEEETLEKNGNSTNEKKNETNEYEEENETLALQENVSNEEDEEKEIEISADKKIEVDNEQGVMIVTGNAFVKEGVTSLQADMLTAFTCETKKGDTKILQINADNNVVIISDQGKAFAERGIYFVEEKIIELYDKVKLEKDGDILVGDKGIFNVLTGKGEISIEPNKVGGRKKVYGIIRSKKNKEGLVVKNLNKSFSKNEVLNDINLNVHRSEAVGLLGPNGAGKTTCFHILTGIIKPNKGKILVDGIDITNFPIYIRSKLGIGYLPQEPSVFRGLNVEENLMSILEYTEPDKNKRNEFLEDLLKDFSLIEKRKQNAMKLSGGQRRRVEIARTLCTKPNFILLDEPFTGIDPLQLNEIKNLIKNLKKRNIGVLITDHNVREALTIIDRAYIIHEGNVLMQGRPKDIINNKLVKKVYLGDTFKI